MDSLVRHDELCGGESLMCWAARGQWVRIDSIVDVQFLKMRCQESINDEP